MRAPDRYPLTCKLPLQFTAAEAAEQRIRSQMPNAARAARASVVIDSSGPKAQTAAKLAEAAAALRRRVKDEYGFDLVPMQTNAAEPS